MDRLPLVAVFGCELGFGLLPVPVEELVDGLHRVVLQAHARTPASQSGLCRRPSTDPNFGLLPTGVLRRAIANDPRIQLERRVTACSPSTVVQMYSYGAQAAHHPPSSDHLPTVLPSIVVLRTSRRGSGHGKESGLTGVEI
jgi:hypothetical protein